MTQHETIGPESDVSDGFDLVAEPAFAEPAGTSNGVRNVVEATLTGKVMGREFTEVHDISYANTPHLIVRCDDLGTQIRKLVDVIGNSTNYFQPFVKQVNVGSTDFKISVIHIFPHTMIRVSFVHPVDNQEYSTQVQLKPFKLNFEQLDANELASLKASFPDFEVGKYFAISQCFMMLESATSEFRYPFERVDVNEEGYSEKMAYFEPFTLDRIFEILNASAYDA